MAKQVTSQEIYENNIFSNLKKETQEQIDLMDKLDGKVIEFSKHLKESVKGLKFDNSKDFQTLSNAMESSNKMTKESIALEKEMANLRKVNAQATLAETKAQEAQAKATNRQTRETEKLNSAYKQESARLNELRNNYKNLAIQNHQNTKEGKALFPVMPSHYYGQMDEEDIKCIIAYIRTLKPIENKPEESVSDFPMNLIINTIPHKANPQKLPPVTDVVNYGKYIANAASCIECHTQFDKGKLVAGTEYGGGREFPFPNGAIIRSSNITTDLETGIGTWKKEQFVSIFRARSDSATLAKKLNPDDFNSIMPWTMYGKMTTQDLEALFAYLRTIKPIKNEVIKFSPKK